MFAISLNLPAIWLHVLRVYAQSCFLALKSNQNTWFSATLDFSLVFVGFLLSPPPYAHTFLRKPSFLVLADFFP
jgi:hypothetical protein